MEIEYEIENRQTDYESPFWPKYRKKYSGIFQVISDMYDWTYFSFPDHGDLWYPLKFKTYEEAKNFLNTEVIPIGADAYHDKIKEKISRKTSFHKSINYDN